MLSWFALLLVNTSEPYVDPAIQGAERNYLLSYMPQDAGDCDFFMVDENGTVHVNRPELHDQIKLAQPVVGSGGTYVDSVSGESFYQSSPPSGTTLTPSQFESSTEVNEYDLALSELILGTDQQVSGSVMDMEGTPQPHALTDPGAPGDNYGSGPYARTFFAGTGG